MKSHPRGVGLLCLAVLATLVAGVRVAAATAEEIIGLSLRGEHRAYPLTLFAQPRVLNDVVGSLEVAVYHDPESGTSAAWFRSVLGEPIEFSGAVAGAVAEDLTTITRWDLASGVAVGGNLQGQRLVAVPFSTTSWEAWVAAHPGARAFGAEGP